LNYWRAASRPAAPKVLKLLVGSRRVPFCPVFQEVVAVAKHTSGIAEFAKTKRRALIGLRKEKKGS
jgi:hypothetical protein